MSFQNNYNELLTVTQREALTLIGNAAVARSVMAYLVGGPVRDLILGCRIYDLDVCIEGDDIRKFCGFLETKFGAKIMSYSEFRTCKMVLVGETIDVAVTRSEIYEHNGSLPLIEHATINRDLTRRDFTINSMAMPILSDELGSVIDLNHGFKDITGRLLRVLHPRSFLDDCTRIFRAVRYSARLGFAIEDETKALLMEGVKEINYVSGTRILNEIIRICDEPERIEILKTLNSLEIFKIIHPKMNFPVEVEKISKNEDLKNWNRTEISCLLLYSSPPEHRVAIAHSLDMPKSVFVALSGLRMLENLDDYDLNSDIYQNLIPVPEAALRVGISCLDDTKSSQIKLFVDHLRDLQLSINGDDVISLGVQPGPLVGELLSQAFSALLNDQLQGRESQLSFVQNLIV